MYLLDNAIAMMFLSFLVGVAADPVLRRLANYQWISTKYLFANSRAYEKLGVLWFRKLLLATPLRMFNTKISFTKSRDLKVLKGIQDHIATAEVSHWVGFTTMLGLTVVAWWFRGSNIGLAYLVFNILGNLYPCLLQQYNKRRLCSLISSIEKRDALHALRSRSA